MQESTTIDQPLLDPVALAHEIAKEAVRQTAYAPRWVSLKQASAMLGGVDKKTLRKWASGTDQDAPAKRIPRQGHGVRRIH